MHDWSHQNIIFYEESIWTSSLQPHDLNQVRSFLIKNNFEYVDISILRPTMPELSRILWQYHYSSTGECISSDFHKKIHPNSNHLKLTVGLKEKNSQEYQNKTISIVNELRLIFGVPIAKELMRLSHFNKDDYIGSSESAKGFASPFLNQALNMFPDIDNAKIRNLPVEVAILLDKAFEQEFPVERFILMWTGFEAIINHIEDGNKNNGQKRKNHFGKLGSEIINNEVKRLFNIRCDLFKEAKFLTTKKMEEENLSLYSIIQLTIMEDCEVRKKLMKGYELSLGEK